MTNRSLFVGLTINLQRSFSAFIGLADVVYIPFAMVMVLTGQNSIHATRFTFKCSCCGRISSTALNRLDLKTKLVSLFPST